MLSEVTHLVSSITKRSCAKTRGTLSDLSFVKDTYVRSYLGGNATRKVEQGLCTAFSSEERVNKC